MTRSPQSHALPGQPASDPSLEQLEWVRHLAFRLARDEARAEDLVQRTALVALERPDALRGADARGIRGWLSQVVRNEARSQWRSDRRRREHESRAVETVPTASDPRDSEDRLDLTRSVVGAVDSLEEPYRSTILARYFDDLSIKEIAARQDVPVRTVETRLQRAKERLRGYLREHAPRGDAWATLVLASWEFAPMAGSGAAGAATALEGASFTTRLAAIQWPLAIAAAATVLLGTWGALRLGRSASDPVSGVEMESSLTFASGEAPLASIPAPTEARVAGPEPAPGPSTGAAQGVPRSVVTGRVVTSLGEPLAGATVRLYSFSEWRAGVDTPAFAISDVPAMSSPIQPQGYFVETDAAGQFVLDVPVPSVGHVQCLIAADPLHDRWQSSFGLQNAAAPPLLEGERDLGTVTLAATGAVRGRVLGPQGQPIALARVGLGSSPSSTLGLDVYTDADGRFTAGHAPAGTHGLRVRHPGYLEQFQQNVTIATGAFSEVLDLTLEVAPVLAGIVTNPEGQPVEGVEVGGRPHIGGGRSARAITGTDGRFEINLPRPVPYSLSAKRSGFQTWGDGRSAEFAFDPGTTDISITLLPLEPLTIRVVDSATGEPMTSFGFYVLPDRGERGRIPLVIPDEMPPVVPRPDGVVSVPAREGVDAYLVHIEGRDPSTGTIVRQGQGAPHMVIQLKQPLAIQGRLLRKDSPVSGASVIAIPGEAPSPGPPYLRGGLAAEEIAHEHMLAERSLGRFDANSFEQRVATTDETGAFEITDLEPGRHAIRFIDGSHVARVLYPVIVEGGTVLLGDVAALEEGSISGRVLVPSGVDPAGLKVVFNAPGATQLATTDEAGRFQFTSVPPGLYELGTTERSNELANSLRVPVEVQEGAESQVEIDCRTRMITPVTLTILVDGRPLAGAKVFAADPQLAGWFSVFVGTADESGVVEGFVRGVGERQVTVSLGNESMPPISVPRLDVPGGVPVDATLDLFLSDLSVTMPASVSVPATGEVHVFFLPEADPGHIPMIRLPLENGQVAGELAALARIEGHTLHLRFAPRIRCRVALMIGDAEGERTSTPVPGTTSSVFAFPSVYATVFQMNCAHGSCAPVVLGE